MKTQATPHVALTVPSCRREANSRRAREARERLHRTPGDTEALYELAEAYARMERHAEARDAHRALLVADGRYADLLATDQEPGAHSFIGRFDSVPCPVCDETEGEVVWVGNISHHVRTWGHLDPIRQWVKCASCETLRVDAPPSAAVLERWTEQNTAAGVRASRPDLQEFQSELVGWQTELDAIERAGFGMAWLDELDNPKPRLLEVGSGWGSFVAAADWRGFQATGVTSADQATWAAASLTLPTVVADIGTGLRAEHLPDGVFDVIVLRHPIDCAVRPVEVLQTAARRLAPDGLLVLQAPLHDHPIRRLQGYDAPHWSRPERSVSFTRDTLEVALARAGLRTDEIRHPHDASPGTALVFVRHDDMHEVMGAE
jgi:SAM-dependent methyltransferase